MEEGGKNPIPKPLLELPSGYLSKPPTFRKRFFLGVLQVNRWHLQRGKGNPVDINTQPGDGNWIPE